MPDDLSPQALTWAHFMASESFGLGHASDQLIEICCPGMNPIALTGRELRRAKARRTAVKTATCIKNLRKWQAYKKSLEVATND